MELRHLRYFVAVAEEMNIHRAAERLNISQPPLSVTIKQLEEEMGTNLFTREGRNIQITRAGEEFLTYARDTLAENDKAKLKTRLIGDGKKGVLKLGFISSSITGILQDILMHSRKVNPDIILDVSQGVNGYLGQQVMDGYYDLALLRHPEFMLQGLTVHKLTQESWSIVCRIDHEFAKLKSIAIPRLENQPIIFYPRYNNPAGYDDVMSMFQDHGFQPNIIQEAPEQMTIAGLVSSGMGIGVVPSCMSKIKLPDLIHISIDGTEKRTGFSLVHKNNADALIKEFVGSLAINPIETLKT